MQLIPVALLTYTLEHVSQISMSAVVSSLGHTKAMLPKNWSTVQNTTPLTSEYSHVQDLTGIATGMDSRLAIDVTLILQQIQFLNGMAL